MMSSCHVSSESACACVCFVRKSSSSSSSSSEMHGSSKTGGSHLSEDGATVIRSYRFIVRRIYSYISHHSSGESSTQHIISSQTVRL